jgi:TRAP-type C4-dicarboxylate transport system permease small subunit
MWRALYASIDALSRACAYLAGAAIMVIALMQICEIVLRNVFDISLPFVWEYAAYMHVGAVFLAAAYTLRTGGQIQVTLLREVAPRLFPWLSTTVGLVISAFVSYALIKFAYGYAVTGRTSGTINNLPLVYPAFFMAFGASMLTLQLLLRLVHVALGTPEQLPWTGSAASE